MHGAEGSDFDTLAGIPPISLILQLPEPIVVLILSFLDLHSLCSASLVCHALYRISCTNSLWRAQCRSHGWLSGPNTHVFGTDGAVHARMRAVRDRHRAPPPSAKWKLYYANGVRILGAFRGGLFRSKMLQIPGLGRHTHSSLPVLQYDGRTFATTHGGRVVVADLPEPSLKASVAYSVGAGADVTHFHYGRKENVLVTGLINGDVCIHNFNDGAHVATLQGHTDAVQAVRVCGDVIASGSRDNTVRLWSASRRSLHATLDVGERLWSMRLRRNMLIVGTANHRQVAPLQLWDVERGVFTRAITGAARGGGVYDMLFESDSVVVSCGFDAYVRVWDLRLPFQSPCVLCFEDPDDYPMLCVQTGQTGADGSPASSDWRIVTGSRSHGIVRLWDRRMAGVSSRAASGRIGGGGAGFRVTRGVGVARGLVCTYYSRGSRTESSVHSMSLRGGRIFAGLQEGVCVLDFDSGEAATTQTVSATGEIQSMSIVSQAQ